MSTSDTQQRALKRPYRLGSRAVKRDETRRRIVAAAVELHSSVGPARTSVAQIARLARVQRHTYYAHFPDDRSLMLACSGLALERDPLPDTEEWARMPAGKDRVRIGLQQLYAWYDRNQELVACVLRDAEVHDLTREVANMRFGSTLRLAQDLLGENQTEPSRALLTVAIQFACWRALSDSLDPAAAAALLAEAVDCVAART